MLVVKGMNKSGQEGISIGTLLVIVLGIVAVVIIILGFTGSFDFIFGKISLLPGQSLQTAVESCKIAAEQKLQIDYCREFKRVKIADTSQYVTCGYIASKALDPSLTTNTFECAISPEAAAISYCESLRAAGDLRDSDNTIYNEKTCKGHNVLEFQGPPAP